MTSESNSIAAAGVWDWLTADDGTRFRVARFGPSSAPRGTVVILNGRTEFIEKYFEVIGDLLARGYAIASLDWRGQGMSDRSLENRHKGHVEDFDHYISDLRQAITAFVEPNCPRPYRALCHSMGGNIGLRYLGQFPETFESAIFSAPMWGIGTSARTPLWMRMVGGISHRLGWGDAYIPGGKDYNETDRSFEENVLTHDPARFGRFVAQIDAQPRLELGAPTFACARFGRFVAQIDAQPRLELGAPTFAWARQAVRSMDVIHAPGFAETIRIPIRICSAGADALVSVEAQRLVADRLSNGEQIVVAGSRHELLMEIDSYRDQIFAAFDSL
ncbi:MAG: alpha/beta hydrolase [Deltaproteobacteria bacterium]|nr:alpha/beta hydrolase [Deltaproteobacteria bacterium]